MTRSFEPHYPLSRDEFRRALRLGLGRAHVHVAKFGAREFRHEIFEAATACQTYDAQLEGLAADWLAQLAIQADLVQEIVELRWPKDDHDRQLHCAILKEFVTRGHDVARPALYASCRRSERTSDVYACLEIVELDGESGLVFVAHILGDCLIADAEFWVDDSVLARFDASRGAGQAVQFLRTHAVADVAIAEYLARVVETKRYRERSNPSTHRSVEDVLRAIQTSERPLHWLGSWGKRARADELERIVSLLDSAASPVVHHNVLRCSSRSEQLALQPRFFGLLRHDDAIVRCLAAQALGHHVDERVRAAGLGLLTFDVEAALGLLRKNTLSVDCAAIALALHSVDDLGDPHGVVTAALELLEASTHARDPSIALWVYEHSPCRMCRKDAVEFLVNANTCPPWLLDEGAHDANEDIRALCSPPATS